MVAQYKNSIHDDLETLKKTVAKIQLQINTLNEDVFLTPAESRELTKSIERFKRGKTISLEKVKYELEK